MGEFDQYKAAEADHLRGRVDELLAENTQLRAQVEQLRQALKTTGVAP